MHTSNLLVSFSNQSGAVEKQLGILEEQQILDLLTRR